MRIGILGGGQLARMLALSGYPLGFSFTILDPAADACAAPISQHLHGNYDDLQLLQQLADSCDVVTYEFENVPAASVEFLRQRVTVYPPPYALATAQDRLLEKQMFGRLAIDTAPFVAVESLDELILAMETIGYPAILKTRTHGYDGKGQVRIYNSKDLADAWQQIAGVTAIVEAFVPFDREISIIAARNQQGDTVCYPVTENHHEHGILRLSLHKDNDSIWQLAQNHVQKLLQELDYVGTIALELFQQGEKLLANEFAPRVHNSGHWTMEGSATSQFANHIRAISGLPLGSSSSHPFTAMVNCIGAMPTNSDILKLDGSYLHDYGKQPREGRKVGHINLLANDSQQLQQQIESVLALLPANTSITS